MCVCGFPSTLHLSQDNRLLNQEFKLTNNLIESELSTGGNRNPFFDNANRPEFKQNQRYKQQQQCEKKKNIVRNIKI